MLLNLHKDPLPHNHHPGLRSSSRLAQEGKRERERSRQIISDVSLLHLSHQKQQESSYFRILSHMWYLHQILFCQSVYFSPLLFNCSSSLFSFLIILLLSLVCVHNSLINIKLVAVMLISINDLMSIVWKDVSSTHAKREQPKEIERGRERIGDGNPLLFLFNK